MYYAEVEWEMAAGGVNIIRITTLEEITPIEPEPEPTQPEDIAFDKAKDVLPDGRMTEEKTEEYLAKLIENIRAS